MLVTVHRILCVAVFLPALAAWAGDAPAAEAQADADGSPRFYLVGVGPGDADLITLRAIKAIERADVLFCFESFRERFAEYLEDKQVHYGFWRLFPYYGQDPEELQGDERRECDQIAAKRNQFIGLVRRAVAEGKTVAVLDSGDPLIYGPYAWCLEEFEDLDPVVIPGVSCFNAANAALGRGITTAESTKSVILTAADWPGKTDTIDKLARHGSTMVVFTMRTEFAEFIQKIAAGYPPETPLAIVKYAGYGDREAVVETTLGKVLDEVDPSELPFEYLIYVGDFLTYRYRKAERMQPAGAER